MFVSTITRLNQTLRDDMSIVKDDYRWKGVDGINKPLVNIWQYSPGHNFTVFSPNVFILLCTSSFIPSLSPYQQNKEIDGVKVRNWGAASTRNRVKSDVRCMHICITAKIKNMALTLFHTVD